MKSVTSRWVANFLAITVVTLALIVLVGTAAAREYYYNSAEQLLTNRVELMVNMLGSVEGDDVAIGSALEDMVANFKDTATFEVMLLDKSGQVSISSSGVMPEIEFLNDDYEAAQMSQSGYGSATRHYGKAGNLLSVCYVGSDLGDVGGIRIVSCTDNIDHRILILTLIMIGASGRVVLFVVLSGRFFIQSIVKPIGEIGAMTTKIAAGDFSVRLKKEHDDEIGQLCDLINYMSEELQKADQIKNDFISQVSHELRTPLTAIKGWGETVLSAGVNDRETVQKGMGVILSETDRLSNMVSELLDFSRMQSGRMTLVLAKMDLIAEVMDVVVMFDERARREGISLEFEDTDIVTPVFGDKSRLRQVFINIIDNAFKYTSQGGRIYVRAEEDSGYIRVSVIDTGAGIPIEDLPKVKEKFVKGSNAVHGTGIGLAVVDEIMKLHKGSFDIGSIEGKGTIVTVSVPIMDESVNQSTMQIAKIDEEMLAEYETGKHEQEL